MVVSVWTVGERDRRRFRCESGSDVVVFVVLMVVAEDLKF
ncbi:hypothetical protein L195_g031168 [Trifolium pratense]|uniref:Uncharacterized protein n=1 Tax=Trifolium pratense TaxID=57577 RepID=A0A2K3L9M6_TRIPR|nr:hypothetical protein L195_g031168 [Trifolium pratense]